MNSLVTTLSLLSFFIGQWLVTRHRCSGFLIWAASNLMLSIASLVEGSHTTAFMFAVYFIANANSLIHWMRNKPASQSDPTLDAQPPAPSIAR